jgi:oligopeptide transport system substrate-binding protein
MTSRKSPWSLLAMLVALALVAAACQPTATPPGATQAPAAGGDQDPDATLVTNVGNEPDSIDPHKASFVGEIAVITTVFENLMVLDPKTLKPVPGAAASPATVSADGLKYTYTLRDGLKFSDGTPLTAKDFVFGYARTCDPATEGQYSYVLYVIAGCEAWNTMDLTKATPAELQAAKDKLGVKAIGDKQVEFTVIEPAPYFDSIVTLWTGMPARESDVTKGGDSWTEPATYIGNGPFKMVEWKHNESMTFEANTNYRLPTKLKKWQFVMVSETAVAFAAYQNNQLDITAVTSENLRAVEGDAKLKGEMIDVPGDCTFYYGFNLRKAPFDDAKVRMAFAKSFDRKSFVDTVQAGIGKAADGGFIAFGQPAYDENDKIQAFDVAAAKKLLTESKYAGAAGLPAIKFTFSSTNLNKLRAEWVQQQWKANLGVEIALDPVESTVFTQLVKQPETTPQMFFLGWCLDFPDPQNWHSTVWKSGAGVSAGRTGYNNPEFDKTTGNADREKDPAKRNDLYLQAGKILSQDAPAAWLYYSQSKALIKPWVKGLSISARGITSLNKHDIYVAKH